MMMNTTAYSFESILPFPLVETEPKVREALQEEKFGIIMEIDIQATLKKKLNIEHTPHKILGACNPQMAHTALEDNPDVALALPCNVVLREEAGKTHVSAMLPSVALKPFQGLKVQQTSCTAEEALKRVFDRLSQCAPDHHPNFTI